MGSRLELAAEMKLPGKAWLIWRVDSAPAGSVLHQEAFFQPRGLIGRLYWFALLPLHGLIFGRMARRIAAAAETRPS